MLVFTDGRSVYTVKSKGYVVQTDPASAQVELQPVAMVFQLLINSSFNLKKKFFF